MLALQIVENKEKYSLKEQINQLTIELGKKNQEFVILQKEY